MKIISNRDKIVVWKSMFYTWRVSFTFISKPNYGESYLSRTPPLVVTTPDGVGRGKYARARVEHGGDTRLSDGNRLLLHRLVDRDAVLVTHLVELVDAHDTGVSEHHRAALQVELALTDNHQNHSPTENENEDERTETESRWTDAVRPAALEPLPDV